MSLLAIGGANSTIPEMHRVAVEVQHWMSDSQFADMFAIAQLSPGPNVLIVTLIGFHVAGVAGALVATFAMCGPSAVVCLFRQHHLLRRSSHASWPAIFQAALVPISIGLMCASGFVLTLTSDRTWAAAAITIDSGRPGDRHPPQSDLDVDCWGLAWFCWRRLTKIDKQKGIGVTPVQKVERAEVRVMGDTSMSEAPSSATNPSTQHAVIKGPQDFYGGLALMAIALFALWASSDLQGMRGFSFGPGTAPRMFGVLLAFSALVLP